MRYDVTIDGNAGQLSIEEGSFRYQRDNGDLVEHPYTLSAGREGTSSVLMDGRSFTVTVLGDGAYSVNGRVYRVEILDPRSLRGRKTAGATAGRQDIAALMPGRVIRVLVKPGDAVEAGQGLIVVEAMKMQNEIKSPKGGRVTEVRTIDGATVAAGDVLLAIE